MFHRSQIPDFDDWIAIENNYFYDHIYDSDLKSFLTPAEFLVCQKCLDNY